MLPSSGTTDTALTYSQYRTTIQHGWVEIEPTRAPVDNEPEIRIEGRPVRASRQVDRSAFPALEARRRVTAALRAHDPDSRSAATKALSEQDYKIIRVIAQEGVVSNVEPDLRYNAIASLAERNGRELKPADGPCAFRRGFLRARTRVAGARRGRNADCAAGDRPAFGRNGAI